MSPEQEPPVRLNGREQNPPPGGAAGAGRSGRVGRRGRRPRWAMFRLFLIVLSAVGVLAALVLWVTGHATAALRVLAGDVLALVISLLLAS